MRKRILAAAAIFTAVISTSGASDKLVIARGEAALTTSCGEGGKAIARLPQGHPVKLRFALAGVDSRCYSVTTEVEGRPVSGFLPREALSGLDSFEQQRREASSQRMVSEAIRQLWAPTTGDPTAETVEQRYRGGLPAAMVAASAALNEGKPAEANRLLAEASLPAENRDAAVIRARALLQLTRPTEAQAVVEPALRSSPEDPELLALAGLIAIQRDDLTSAARYLRRSIEVQPNPSLERMLRNVERESNSSGADSQTYGSRFVLRYEDAALPEDAARALREVIEREINRISYELGCRLDERLTVIVQSRENYHKATGAAEWSGGRYDGRIHIAVPPDGRADARVRKTFSHEFVHACLARMGRWPSWLHEGLAQRLSGDTVSARDREGLQRLAEEKALPSLEKLSGSWAWMDGRRATIAYTLSLAAVDLYYDEFRAYGIRNLLQNPGELPRITKELDARLREKLR